METFKTSADVLFILLGAIMILAMHAGFAFLELGTVRRKSQVNALVKILSDFAVSTLAYFFIGYSIAYGTNFFAGATSRSSTNCGTRFCRTRPMPRSSHRRITTACWATWT